jgi:23S rRNA (cytosine1962-C5)-methyltransferase
MRLKPGREKSLLRRHPWIYSGAVAELRGAPSNGETVQIIDAKGNFLAWAAYSSLSQICGRVWSWRIEEKVDIDFFRLKIAAAVSTRARVELARATDALRLVYGESDGLPGVIVDRYGDFLVSQFLSSGAERWKDQIADILKEVTGAKGIYERSDAEVRRLEGLTEHSGLLRGQEPGAKLLIHENGLKYWVDIRQGHKTGFYLDQRANRLRLRSLVEGLEVLDCFCYTGGFSVNAFAGGAKSVTAVDSATDALALAAENLNLNGFSGLSYSQIQGDVFLILRKLRDQARQFDLVVLDPPKFAPTTALVQQAARGYKDINLLAFKLLRPGGLLVTFSCSGGVSMELFQKIVAGAAVDAGVQAQIVDQLHQAADHPIALSYPEGAYLKGLVVSISK